VGKAIGLSRALWPESAGGAQEDTMRHPSQTETNEVINGIKATQRAVEAIWA